MHKGEYMFTLDTCHSQHSTLNVNFSEHDPEHKSFNFIKMNNGQFAAQPNNRTIFTDQSLVVGDRKIPDFKVCTQNYTVENNPKWSVGHTDEWQYKSKDEEEIGSSNT
jgi:type 1 glutamine amidotransferase